MTFIDSELVPVVPDEEHRRHTGETSWDWARRNLFRGPVDIVITIVSTVVVAYVLYRLGRFVFVTGRWKIVRVNLRLFMVGRYPYADYWRIVVSVLGIAALLGRRGRQRNPGATPRARAAGADVGPAARHGRRAADVAAPRRRRAAPVR